MGNPCRNVKITKIKNDSRQRETVCNTVHSEIFFPNFVWFLRSDWAQIFRKDSLCHPLAPNFFFGGVIFKITAEFRFFSPFPWKRSKYNSFSQTLFDYNTLVSCSIFPKFSGKTPDAIFLPQFSFRVVIFSLRCPETLFISHEHANFLFSVLRVVQGEAKHQK